MSRLLPKITRNDPLEVMLASMRWFYERAQEGRSVDYNLKVAAAIAAKAAPYVHAPRREVEAPRQKALHEMSEEDLRALLARPVDAVGTSGGR